MHALVAANDMLEDAAKYTVRFVRIAKGEESDHGGELPFVEVKAWHAVDGSAPCEEHPEWEFDSEEHRMMMLNPDRLMRSKALARVSHQRV